ncbi:hypothetical protein BROUX41_005229 [Berkeleyomyces rouxiae]
MSTNMTADTTPITPERFAAAITELNQSTLYLKVLEIRNSIAHLVSSNAQLQEFATGADADAVCIEAIRENEQVIARMDARIALIRAEIENRGASWEEFDRAPAFDLRAPAAAANDNNEDDQAEPAVMAPTASNGINGTARPNGTAPVHPAWMDGTFQVGTISNGQVRMGQAAAAPRATDSGPLENAEDLERRLQQRLAELGAAEDNEDGDAGLHL